MQSILFILVSLLLMLSACSTENGTSSTRSQPSTPDTSTAIPHTTATTSFQTSFARFLEALHSADTAAINRFIHPKYGLWIIEQPGALPKMTQVFEIQKFGREYQNRSFFTLALEVKQCNLIEEAFPAFDCADLNYEAGKTGYRKDGCFVWNAAEFRNKGYWNYASLSATQLESINGALPFVQQSVLHTPTSFEFHFGYLEGQWYLLFAKIIYPCSA